MSGRGDDKVERGISAALAKGPHDFLALIAALRKTLPGLLRLREGLVHAVLLYCVRRGRVLVGGPSPRGLASYRLLDTPEPAAARDIPPLGPVDDASIARTALRTVSTACRPSRPT